MQIFQRLMEGMNRRERLHLNQMSSAVRSAQTRKFIAQFSIVEYVVYLSQTQ